MLKTKKFDVTDYLKTEKDIDEYLDTALEEEDWRFLPVALADIAKARRAMSRAAEADGVPGTSLYQPFSADGRPSFETVAQAAAALGYRITLVKKSV